MLFALVSSLAVLAVPVAGTHGVDSNAMHIFNRLEASSGYKATGYGLYEIAPYTARGVLR